jgi:hypothetical protein
VCVGGGESDGGVVGGSSLGLGSFEVALIQMLLNEAIGERILESSGDLLLSIGAGDGRHGAK